MIRYENYFNKFHIQNDRYNLENNLYDNTSLIMIDYKQKIPKKIHQTYIEKILDIRYYETCMINKYMNPEYEYTYYTDVDVSNYIRDNFPEYLNAYNSLIPSAYKIDLFRYLVLYNEGGVYIDCKSSTIVPLRKFIKNDIGLCTFKDRLKGSIQIGFIASVPRHPLLKKCIDTYIQYFTENKKYGINPFDITGPQVCGRALNILLYKDQLEDIKSNTYTNIDVDIIGSFYTFGKNKYEILCDSKLNPLVSRTSDSYNTKKSVNIRNIYNLISNDYSVKWILKRVYKNE